jgi:DNA-binding response OmpR family regulator
MRKRHDATPVLVTSHCTATDHKLRAMRAGVDGYITKPFHHEELFELATL